MMGTHPRLRTAAVSLLCACFALLLPACAGGSGDTSTAERLKTGPRLGQLAPDFTLEGAGGGPVRLAGLRGTPVLLNFWATWCVPCRKEMPDFQQVHDSRAGRLAVVAVDLGESAQQVSDFTTELGITYPTVIDREKKVAETYRVVGLPATFLIDREGVVRAVRFGAFKDVAEIEKALGKVGL